MAYYNLRLKHYFVHIPKNGGKAVADFLTNLPDDFAFEPMFEGHLTAQEIETELNKKFPDVSWTGITTVRNPYTRYASAYDFSLYTAKLMIEGRHRKADKVVNDVEQSWIEIGKLTPHTMLEQWINNREFFNTNLAYIMPALKQQSVFVLPTTVKFNVEALKHFKQYFENLTHMHLNNITVQNATPLPYAKLQGLRPETKQLINEYYADDFILGKYTKEVING